MSNQLKIIYSKLETDLAVLKRKNLKSIDEAEDAIQLIEQCLSLIQEKLATHKFCSTLDEILYFKEEFPKIFRLYYYYKTVFNIESEKYFNCITTAKEIEFYTNCIPLLHSVDEDEIILLRESKCTFNHKSKKFYLRKHFKWRRRNLTTAMNETYVTNSMSVAIGKRYAKADVINYLETKIANLNNKSSLPKSPLRWTASKVLLVELIYALSLTGCINDGEVELAQLIFQFEVLFNVELENHNSIIQNIKARKINKTKFIDMLREYLRNKFLD